MSTKTKSGERPSSGQATIRDVARLAGVGVGTVSRVTSDSPGVSDRTRAKVQEAIDQLGYRRSISARNLALGRTQSIGVAVPFLPSPSVSLRVQGVMDALSAAGSYDLQVFDVSTHAQLDDMYERFARRDRIDGLILFALCPDERQLALLRSERLPVVLVDGRHPELHSIAIDNVRGGELAAEHLLALGHQRIGFLGDRNAVLGFTSSNDRQLGLRQRLAAEGINSDPALDRIDRVDFIRPQDRIRARELAFELLRLKPRPTAIFAASDYLACGALDAARSLRLRVPEDVAVLGFDDIDLAEILQLSTIRQPLHETGRKGVKWMLELLRGEGGAPAELLEPLTVVRRSTT